MTTPSDQVTSSDEESDSNEDTNNENEGAAEDEQCNELLSSKDYENGSLHSETMQLPTLGELSATIEDLSATIWEQFLQRYNVLTLPLNFQH